MYTKTLECLDRLINHVSVNAFLSDKVDLFEGRAGIVILLYYYSRYRQNSEVKELSDKLLDVVIDKISDNSEREVVGIALMICNLMNDNYIVKDLGIFAEIDNWLFASKAESKVPFDLNDKILTGLYIYRRMELDSREYEVVWEQRMKSFFEMIYLILSNKRYYIVFPIIECSVLSILMYLCSRFEDKDDFKEYIKLLYQDLSLIVKMSMHEDENNSDKYILSLLVAKRNLKVDYASSELFKTVTLLDINHFYWYRYLLRIEITTPKIIEKTMLAITEDVNRINRLLHFLNANNCGINGYVSGLSWGIVQWIIDRTRLD